MINMFRRTNEALPSLVLTMILYGVVVQLIGVWFVKDKLSYSIGLWYGVAVAIWMAYNIAQVIYDSVSLYGDKNANRRIIIKSVLRYFIVCILFGIIGYFKFGNLYSAIAGVLSLKIGAYLQPLMIKATNKLLGRSDASDHEEIV